ncbi:MAG: hypothetical protein KBT44_01850 [Bacteroidales bacterium]|nr:hypothetical protein [Candidatus Equibacterium intestinale]
MKNSTDNNVLAVILLASLLFQGCKKDPQPLITYDNLIEVDATQLGGVLPNIGSNVNTWDMGTMFYNPKVNEEFNVFEFVKYVQFMQCTGGSLGRDLFRNPGMPEMRDDYKFSPLVKNCAGVLKLGAKPHLKLGSVPLKLTTGAELSPDFGTNIYPPDDYEEYYRYIKAIIQALVDEFGLEEVRTWHFGCMTEYENGQWFMAKSRKSEDSFVEYCKLYDYTVQALIDVLGEDVYVGAHSMTTSEGLWNEEKFIEHCAKGTNYANGGKGSRLCYLAASFYDTAPGKFTTNHDLPTTVGILKGAAVANGLTNIDFGIDEGRILCGITAGSESNQAYNRVVGYTWQAAYDARIFKQGIDAGLNYFSSWNLLTGSNTVGYPIISYHVVSNMSKFEGYNRASVNVDMKALNPGEEVDCLAGTDGNTVRVMVYNFKNDIKYKRRIKYQLHVKLPFDAKEVKVIRYLVSDDCNFFDEWVADREELGITSKDFGWSPDDPMVDNSVTLRSSSAITKYKTKKEQYKECARLIPVTETVKVSKGLLELDETIDGCNVLFLEITR